MSAVHEDADARYFDIPDLDTSDESTASESDSPELTATLVINGRNVEIPDHFRRHIADKIARLEKFDPLIHIFEVELNHERNRRQSKACQRVQITARNGQTVRSESSAETFYAALDAAIKKLATRLRRAHDRKKVTYGQHRPVSLAEATSVSTRDSSPQPSDSQSTSRIDETEYDGPGRIVRTKEHPDVPITVDEALSRMELVGHDFYLFHDVETDRPCVVYRRHAFDYGLIRLASDAG